MKKGDSTTPIILWLTIITATLIIIVWYARTAAPLYADYGVIDEDLKNIREEFALACNHELLETSVRFHVQKGTFTYNKSLSCIKQQLGTQEVVRCVKTPCDVGSGEVNIAEITRLSISKAGTIEVRGE